MSTQLKIITATIIFVLAIAGCEALPPQMPSPEVRQILDLKTPRYTGGLTLEDRALADRIHKALLSRYFAVCDPFNSFQGELVSSDFGKPTPLPSLDGVDPDLALLIRALDHDRQEVRDTAAYTLGLLGPSARAAEPFLRAKFNRPTVRGGWFGVGLEGISCEPVGSMGARQTIPNEIFPFPDDLTSSAFSTEQKNAAAATLANLYLDPDVLYPPDLLAEYFSGLDTRPALDVAHRVLLRILEAPQINVRTQIEAVAAMNSIEDTWPDSLPVLLRLANTKNEELRYYLTAALVRLRSERAIPLLIAGLRDDDWAGSWDKALCSYGAASREAEDALHALLRRTDWARVQHKAVDTLACAGTAKSLPVLTAMLDGNDWQMSESAAKALGKIGINEPGTVAALKAVYKDHWSALVRYAAGEALYELGNSPPDFLMKVPPPPSDVVQIGGPPQPYDHGLPYCDESGRYSIDGKTWFSVRWLKPSLEPVPRRFSRKNVLIQTVGTQSFLRVANGWLYGSDGFESEGVLVHVADNGIVTDLDASEPGVPFGHATIRGIVRTKGTYYAFGFELLKAGEAGTLFEIATDPNGAWKARRVAILPSAPYSHALAPSGELLLSDGPNDYAIVDGRIVPLKCEKTVPKSYFEGRD